MPVVSFSESFTHLLPQDDINNDWITGMNRWCFYSVLFSIAAMLGVPCTGIAAVADHVTSVEIYQSIDYVFPDQAEDTMHEFSFFAWTDGFVKSVSVACPGGRTFTVTRENYRIGEERTLYEYDPEADRALFDFYADYTNSDISILHPYGDGDYVVTVTYDSGESESTAISFRKKDGISSIPYFTGVPLLAEPAHNANLSGNSPVTIRWNSEDIETGAKDLGITCRRPTTDVDSPEYRQEFAVDNNPGQLEVDLDRGDWHLRYAYGHIVTAVTSEEIPYQVGKAVVSTYAITIRGNSLPWLPLLLTDE